MEKQKHLMETGKIKNTMAITQKQKAFLDELRESGLVNMLGASSAIMEEFEVDKKEANSILREWIKTYQKPAPKENWTGLENALSGALNKVIQKEKHEISRPKRNK